MLKRDKKIDPKKFSIFKRFIPRAKEISKSKLNRGIYREQGAWDNIKNMSDNEWIKRIINHIRAADLTMSDNDMIKDPGKAMTYYRENINENENMSDILESIERKIKNGM
jgi:hypothetical protein